MDRYSFDFDATAETVPWFRAFEFKRAKSTENTDRRLRQGEVENSKFSEISETSENIFPRFSAPSFPFCTSLYPKMENSELEKLGRSLIKMR